MLYMLYNDCHAISHFITEAASITSSNTTLQYKTINIDIMLFNVITTNHKNVKNVYASSSLSVKNTHSPKRILLGIDAKSNGLELQGLGGKKDFLSLSLYKRMSIPLPPGFLFECHFFFST